MRLFRTKTTQSKYDNTPKNSNFIQELPSLWEFKYWRIIENQYPYDAIAKTHHLLVPKRKTGSADDLLEEEEEELKRIQNDFLREKYDSIMLHFRHNRTVKSWLHYHLLNYENSVEFEK